MPVTAAPADVYVYLTATAARTGQDVRAVALAWAHAQAGDWSWYLAASDIVVALLNPREPRAPLDDCLDLAVELMADPGWPAWVRAALAWRHLGHIRGLYAAELAEASGPANADYRAWIRRLLTRWEEAERSVWDSVPWPGPFVPDPVPGWQAARLLWFETQYPLARQQLAWCRARLRDPRTRGPELGLALRRLWDAGSLTADELAQLAPGWRSRFLRSLGGETFSCLPAVVVYGMALAEFGVPNQLFAHVRERRDRWTDNVYAPLVGWYGSAAEVEEQWGRAVRGGAGWPVLLGATVGRARLDGLSLRRACDLAAAEAGSPAGFLAVALAHGWPRRLWAGRIETAEPQWAVRAAQLAADASLSPAFRRAAAAVCPAPQGSGKTGS